ncbi:MAG: hypothetical protein JEZ00_11500 [Anaerolineaceae bacterium]|nr:hypothetical protein [Anaerolineaceae bacterium]
MNQNPIESNPIFTRRNLWIALTLAIVLAIGIIAIRMIPLDRQQKDAVSGQDDQMASEAAVMAMESFFNIDAKEGKEVWLDRICTISTESGCELLSAGADAMWAHYQEENIHISALVSPVKKISETEREQVWQMSILLSAPLPGSNKTEDMAYVVMTKKEGIWKFDRFLLKPEIDSILSYRTVADSLATEQAWY